MKRPTAGNAIWSVLVSLPIAAALSGGCGSLDYGSEPAGAPTVAPPPVAPPPAAPSPTPASPLVAPTPRPAPPPSQPATTAPTSPPTSGPGVGSTPPPDLDPSGPDCTSTQRVLARIVKPKCALCHDKSDPTLFAAGLDLTSPRLREQLQRSASRQCPGPVQGVGRPMVFTEPYVGGHFFDVINGVQGCGQRMPPIGPPLSRVEIQCLRTWLAGRD